MNLVLKVCLGVIVAVVMLFMYAFYIALGFMLGALTKFIITGVGPKWFMEFP